MVAPRTVVVGGGPSGLAAAFLLHELGAQVTLIERAENPASLDIFRSYSLLAMNRALRVLRRMGLSDTLRKLGVSSHIIKMTVLRPAMAPKQYEFRPKSSGVFTNRATLMRLMLDCVRALPLVDMRMGASVSDVRFTADGAIVHLTDASGAAVGEVSADLVIAADGVNSVVRRALVRDGGAVTSTHGFGLRMLGSEMQSRRYKMVQFSVDARVPICENGDLQRMAPDEAYVFVGAMSGRDFVRVSLVPVASSIDVPRTASISSSPDAEIWKCSNSEKTLKILEENFPQLGIRSIVPESVIERFAASEPSQFPRVQRIESIVGTVGNNVGVAFVGDAAHAFPPDIGQGVNSALEDVEELVKALRDSTSLRDALQKYETARDGEIEALVQLAQIEAPVRLVQNKPLWLLVSSIILLRRILHRIAPSWFAPTIFEMVHDTPYSDTLKLHNQSTRRIWTLVGASAALCLSMYLATKTK